MISITLQSKEPLWDEEHERFIKIEPTVITLEHSLISVSKWESKHHKAFLASNDKSQEEILDYIKCMSIGKIQDENALYLLSEKNVDDITKYINDTMTATVIPKKSGNGGVNSEILTSERIYYYMTFFNIPVEFERWHLNRLLTLIQVCNSKQEPEKKMTPGEIASRNAALNAKRRAQYESMG